MATLSCAVLGTGRVFSLDVDGHECVGKLRLKIRAAAPQLIWFDPRLLELYHVKDLKSDDEDLAQLQVPSRILDLIESAKPLPAITNVGLLFAYRFDKRFRVCEGEVDVVVKLPSEGDYDIVAKNGGQVDSRARRARWRKLNVVLDSINESRTEHSDAIELSLDEIRQAFASEDFVQKRKPVPLATTDFLVQHLTHTTNTMPLVLNDGPLRLVIAPMLTTLASLFDDLTIDVDKIVPGEMIEGTARVDYVLKRGGKTVMCVAEAKHGDLGIAAGNALVASEELSTAEKLSVVYAVATNFTEWHLYRVDDDAVGKEEAKIRVDSGQVDVSSFSDVCAMLCGALDESS